MLAARLAGVGTFDVVDVPVPDPGEGEVRVRVAAVSICGSDVAAYRGHHPRIKAPVVLGHECSGVVDEVGPGVGGVHPGDRVAVEPTVPCRRCRHCARGRENVCVAYRVLGEEEALPGAFAGAVTVAADRLHVLPEGIGFEEGALIQPLAIGLHAVRHRARVAAGETVLVVGAGPIGTAVLLHCKAAGATVIAAEVLPGRRRMAARLGADAVLDPAADDVDAAVRAATGGYGVDVAFEAVGGRSDEPLDLAVRCTARAGRVVVLGSFAAATASLRLNHVKFGEIDLLGSQAHPGSFPGAIAAVADGTTPVRDLVTHRFPVSRVADAFELLERRPDEVMKVVLIPEASEGPSARA